MTTVTDTRLPAWYPPERVARYYDLGLWTGEVLTDLVRRNAERDPHGLCVADGRRVLTFADALEESERLARISSTVLGIGPGDPRRRPAAQLVGGCGQLLRDRQARRRVRPAHDDLPRVRDPRRRRPAAPGRSSCPARSGVSDHARHGRLSARAGGLDRARDSGRPACETERWASRICSPERPTTAGGPTPATGTSSCSRRARRRARRGPSTRSTRSRPAPARCASASASAQPTAASCRRRSCTTPG